MRVSVGDSMPLNGYVYGYDPNYQQQTVSAVNSGSGDPSMAIWANRENPVGQNLANISEGRRGLNVSHGILSPNSSVGHQQSFNRAVFDNINAFLALQDYDIIELGKTQCCSVQLQKILSSWKDSKITNKIFEAVFEYPFDLMTDEYGCHLFVKLIQSCNEIQLGRIIVKITSQSQLFYKASLNKNG